MHVAVLGAGISGLAATLALARAGHRVTLVERDDVEVGDPLDSVDWTRRGIPHFLQAHSFTSRGYKELRDAFPDVLQALIDAGADDIDLARKMPGGSEPGDEDLRVLGVRRPLIEWALRRAIVAEPSVRVIAPMKVVGLEATSGDVPKVSGIRTSDGSFDSDLVIDAMGRRSPAPGWIAALGGTPMSEEASDCGVIYYTRYYRVREGQSLPDGPWLPTPRADLGYGLFSSFPGDNGTFAGLIAIPPRRPGPQAAPARGGVRRRDTPHAGALVLGAPGDIDADHGSPADGQPPEHAPDAGRCAPARSRPHQHWRRAVPHGPGLRARDVVRLHRGPGAA